MEYRDEDWPHGLRCARCHRLMREGDRYSESLDSFIHEAAATVIVCAGCATPGGPNDGE